jgi:hypothetical protein
VKETEFPNRPPRWIKRLADAIKGLAGSDMKEVARQAEVLKALPAENLGPLNDELFKNASRLQPQQLIASLDEILAVLDAAGNPAMAKLRDDELVEFRALCSVLDELIAAHNLCQQIDNAFHEAPGLSSVTTKTLTDWDIAKQSLDELAAQRKHDRRVQRTTEAARLFEAADQGEAFLNLAEKFGNLFMETDKALLKVTNKMPRKAIALHSALEAVR